MAKKKQLKLYKFVLEPPPRHAAYIVIVSKCVSAMCQSELYLCYNWELCESSAVLQPSMQVLMNLNTVRCCQ